MKHNGIDVLTNLQKRWLEFQRMKEIMSRKYRGGWLIATKTTAINQPRRLSQYVVIDDPNVLDIKGCIIGAFGQVHSGSGLAF